MVRDRIPRPLVIPKEYSNGVFEDSDCEDLTFFTEQEVTGTKKCLESTQIIVKDFETQLDWHVHQYMSLRNSVASSQRDKTTKKDTSGSENLLNISQLCSKISSNRDGNQKFFGNPNKKRKKRVARQLTDKDGVRRGRGRPRKAVPRKRVRVSSGEPDEEVVVKEEPVSDEDGDRTEICSKVANHARKKRNVDPTSFKACSVVLNKIGTTEGAIKHEGISRDDLLERLIRTPEEFKITSGKTFVLMKNHNWKDFDLRECSNSNVIVVFEDEDQLPEFIFSKYIAARILKGHILVVKANVYEKYMDQVAHSE